MVIKQKHIYWLSTIILFGTLIATGILYFVYHDTLSIYFKHYGYPTYIIYPLAVAKIVGAMVILYNKNKLLKELAYIGFFFNFILAFFAHYMINEFDPFPSISLLLLLISYFTGKKIRP
ncbi:MAG: DoxX family protein [Bacteroidetes bacterium]|nr:DoxX family protein [Bacteroidota bacterium]